MAFDTLLVEHCSPTLAGLKTANLFSYEYGNEDFMMTIHYWDQMLKSAGIRVTKLKQCGFPNYCLVYVFREKNLKRDLSRAGVMDFLAEMGYSREQSVSELLQTLSARLTDCDRFPHEIGLFLGYPLHDVVGFIIHQGKNSCLNGPWKVYKNPEQARKSFQRYKKCTEIYKRLYQSGRSIAALSVAS